MDEPAKADTKRPGWKILVFLVLLLAVVALFWFSRFAFISASGDRMPKYANILLIRNGTPENVQPVRQFLEGKGLRYFYHAKVLFYEARKMSELDEVEEAARNSGLEYVQVHAHNLPGNFISSNHLPQDTLNSLEEIWAPD